MLNDDEFVEYEEECKRELYAWDYAYRTGLSYDDAYAVLVSNARQRGVVRGTYSQIMSPGLTRVFRDVYEQTHWPLWD